MLSSRSIIEGVKKNKCLIFILMIPMVIMTYWNIKTSNIGFIFFYNLDYWYMSTILMRMYEGLLNLDPRQFYNLDPLWQYGTPIFLVNLVLSFPFIVLGFDNMIIFIHKMILLSFAIISVVYLYRFSRLYLNKITSLLICIMLIGMPGFWDLMDYANPYWMTNVLLISALFYLAKDKGCHSNYFWLSCFLIGLAICTTIQAITYLPILLAYIFHKEITSRDFSDIKSNFILAGKVLCSMLMLYLIINPFIMHPKGFSAVYNTFFASLKQSSNQIPIYEIIFNLISTSYVHYIIFFIIVLLLLYLLYKINKFPLNPINTAISLYLLVNFIYYFFILRSSVFTYLLPIFSVSIMMMVLVLKDVKTNLVNLFLLIISLFNIFSHTLLSDTVHYFHLQHWASYQSDQFHGMSFLNDDRVRLFEYWPISKKSIIMEEQRRNNDFLLTTLKGKVTNNSVVVLEAWIGFEFYKLNLHRSNVSQRHGDPLSIERHLNIADIIVLKKSHQHFISQINLINKYNGSKDKLPFRPNSYCHLPIVVSDAATPFNKIAENNNLCVYLKNTFPNSSSKNNVSS